MNTSSTVLGLALLALLAFFAFDQRYEARHGRELTRQANKERDSVAQRWAWADGQRLNYANQLESGRQAAAQDAGEAYRIGYQAGQHVRTQTSDQQQTETLQRLVNAGTLPASATVVSSPEKGRVHYDSTQQAGLSWYMIEADSANHRHRRVVERLGAVERQLKDTTAKVGRLDNLIGTWVNTRGAFTGKNKRLKQGYQREKLPAPKP